MDLMEKIEQRINQINPKYDIPWPEVVELSNSVESLKDGISLGFRYGYVQGKKAAETKLKEKPDHVPKYKNELRQAIYYQASQTKNVIMLQYLLQIADIFRCLHDEKEYKNLTNLEIHQASTICDILRCKDEECIRHVQVFMSGYLSNRSKRKAGATS